MAFSRYEGEYLREVSMPVGGMGAGCIGLAGNGALVDWEIDGPGKGRMNPYSHFAVKAENSAGVHARILQGDWQKDLSGKYSLCKYDHFGYGYGPEGGTMAGFPHFENCAFEGAFPWGRASFSDRDFPGRPSLSAFSSFIPMDSENSSLPCAFYRVEMENDTDEETVYTVALTLGCIFDRGENRAFFGEGMTGLVIKNGDNSLCAMTNAEDASVQASWFRGGWFDGPTMYWNQFTRPGFLPERSYDTPGDDKGTVEARFTLKSGEKRSVDFVIGWYFPWEVDDWDVGGARWKRWYAARFESALDAGKYAMKNYGDLERRTLAFRDALYSCDMPQSAIEAAGASLSILVTPVCLRLEDGSFYAWEGENETGGSCEGTCQHVWNYAYALPYIFPDMEMSVRRLEKNYSQWDDGRITFRLKLPVGSGRGWKMPCVDGQMGFVLKVYREWKFSGDEGWLKEMWPAAKKALEFAWLDTDVKWDADRDGVLEGRQHHTLDMELFGPSSWLEGFYLAALKAAQEMAEYLGEDGAEYARLYENGRKYLNGELFNGEYYIQKVNLNDRSQLERYEDADKYWNEETGEIKYQIADGLIIDQALAQWHANLMGLGRIYDKDKLDTALKSLYKYSFKEKMGDFCNPCRVFSLDGEAGTVMCEYPPHVKKPAISVPYCQETMTGFEYSAAALMLQEGMAEKAERMIAAVRERYDGKKRNPYNEIECGNNYSRTMAAFSFIPVYAGFECDAVKEHMGFSPIKGGNCRSMWFMAGAWGKVEICENGARLDVEGGEIELKSLGLPFAAEKVTVDGREAAFTLTDGRIVFDRPVKAAACIAVKAR